MEIKISKEYHFNRVEINFTVDDNVNEAEPAISYMKYLLDEMDNLEFDDKPKKEKEESNEEEPKATEKQVNLIKKIFGNDYNTSDMTISEATCLLNSHFNKKK